MRAVRFDQFGSPADQLRVEEIAEPVPGPQEVLIRLAARPINPSDLLNVSGQYGIRPKLPATPGGEGMGRITALGAEVTHLHVGQRVAVLGANQGTWGDYVTARPTLVMPLPDSVDDQQGAMLMVNPPTAWIMLYELLNVQPGEWIIQTAAGSAVGAWVISLAKQIGAKTINVVRRRDQADLLKASGADEVICTADEDLRERVKAITNGKGAQYGLDAVGGELGAQVLAALGRHGTLIVYGALSGDPLPVNVGGMIFRETVVRGFWLSLWAGSATPEQMNRVFGGLFPLLSEKLAESPIEATYDLAQITEAVQHAARAGRNGKILLVG